MPDIPLRVLYEKYSTNDDVYKTRVRDSVYEAVTLRNQSIMNIVCACGALWFIFWLLAVVLGGGSSSTFLCILSIFTVFCIRRTVNHRQSLIRLRRFATDDSLTHVLWFILYYGTSVIQIDTQAITDLGGIFSDADDNEWKNAIIEETATEQQVLDVITSIAARACLVNSISKALQ